MSSNQLSEFKEMLTKKAFGMTVSEAKENGICIDCRNEIKFTGGPSSDPNYTAHTYGEIWTLKGKREYEISGLCEFCFEHLFVDVK